MLRKYEDIEVPAANPYANDKFDRKVFTQNLTRLVQSTQQPFVISLEAPWGWGKSTCLRMWKTDLEAEGHLCLLFSAWENDFVDDPLIAFIGEFGKAMEQAKGTSKLRARLRGLQKLGGRIVRKTLPLTLQLATHGIIDQDTIKNASAALSGGSDEIAKFVAALAEDKIRRYEADKKGVIQFKKELAQLAASIAAGPKSRPPLIFMIDELDRCRPDFALSLLERLKHIFAVPGLVFVLAIDRDQIVQSLKSIYGLGMEADGYLRRIIDLRFSLPSPSTRQFCESLMDAFAVQEVLGQRDNWPDERDTLLRIFSTLSRVYHLSPRVIAQCFTEINVILRTTGPNKNLAPDMLAILVALRAHRRATYDRLLRVTSLSETREILMEIKQELDLEDSECRTIAAIIEVNLLYEPGREAWKNQALEQHRAAADLVTTGKTEKDYAQRVLRFAADMEQWPYSRRAPGTVSYLTGRLEAIADILVV